MTSTEDPFEATEVFRFFFGIFSVLSCAELLLGFALTKVFDADFLGSTFLQVFELFEVFEDGEEEVCLRGRSLVEVGLDNDREDEEEDFNVTWVSCLGTSTVVVGEVGLDND